MKYTKFVIPIVLYKKSRRNECIAIIVEATASYNLDSLGNYACFCHMLIYVIKINSLFFKNIFHEYHKIVKQFGSRPGPMFCHV